MKITIDQRTLHFKQPAGTSRGVYTTRRSWLVTMSDGEHTGLGECAPLPRLSCDDLPHYGQVLRECCDEVARTGVIPARDLSRYPSMLFGLETAMRHLQGGNIDCGHGRKLPVIYDTPFTRGEEGIPINGLVWMGTHDEMLARLEAKLKQGYGCVKLKIGAIDFERELDLIAHIRERFTPEQVELRVDANGGFTPACALKRLEALAPYGIHSIEQPVMAGQWQVMARLCQDSPVPIALDEELIGVNTRERKIELLDTIKPRYIILKPSLHGGIAGTQEWVQLATERGTGSWITSALESNVGLNAIAQLAAHIYGPHIEMPQGLGTGLLYTDNIAMPLEIKGDCLWTSIHS